jgi:PHP family Zn ribbon phosphoesterase
MKKFRADLHIHTVLSACADLEMSPATIVRIAQEKNIDLIAITDHNTTLHCRLVKELAAEKGIAVLCGVEVTTREEVHCLAYFEDLSTVGIFQNYLDNHLPHIPYLPGKFGYQALVDREDKIIRLIENYLNVALNQGIGQVEKEVHSLGGLFVPAHIERPLFGLFNQLGFVPDDLVCDAMGIMGQSNEPDIRNRFNLGATALIKASDAHVPGMIGAGCTWFEMEEPTISEIGKALKGIEGRRTTIE